MRVPGIRLCLWVVAWVITFLSGRWLRYGLDELWYPELWYRWFWWMSPADSWKWRCRFRLWCGRSTGHEASKTECGSSGDGVWSNCRWCGIGMQVGPEHPLYRKYRFLVEPGAGIIDPWGVMSLTEYRLASDRQANKPKL